MPLKASDGVFKLSASAVLLLRSFIANLHFQFCSALILKKLTHKQHKNRTTATATETTEGNYRLNPLMPYSRLSFPPFFWSVNFLPTFIFIVVCRLFISFKLLLYCNISVAFICRNIHNITTQHHQEQKIGWVQSFYFVYLIIL